MMRLAKFLALAGVASRREAEELIRSGQVLVNGKPHLNVGQQIDETIDEVIYNGRQVEAEAKVYYLVHKPVGYLSAAKDSRTDKVVTALVPDKPKVYPVGRLDKDSSGLILLTNDGDLTLRLSHPRYEVAKEYEVVTDKPIGPDIIKALKRGITLEEGLARIDNGKMINPKTVILTLHQGWNRQIRRMLGSLGLGVISLKRISEGQLALGNLPVGQYKKIARPE